MANVGTLEGFLRLMHCRSRMITALVQVSCIDVPTDGTMLAMGTTTTIGVPADIYVWVVDERKMQQTLSLHMVHLRRTACVED